MREEKNTQRSLVNIGFDGRVHKIFRGPKAEERFTTEVKVLEFLERRGCEFVPRLLESDRDLLKIITSNVGKKVEIMGEEKTQEIFQRLETYGVRHEDPYLRNITYRSSDGQFCIIDFEFATILGEEKSKSDGSKEAEADVVVEWNCKTDVGRFRKKNEDEFLALSLDCEGAHFLGSKGSVSLEESDLIFAVSDGMGGARSGEFASRIAVEKITGSLPAHFRSGVAGYNMNLNVLNELYQSINSEMIKVADAYPECKGMGATLSMCWLLPDRLLVSHIGDSRIYRYREESSGQSCLIQLTEDDTRVAAMLRAGKISEYEARNHPMKNMLNKALGAGNQFVDPQVKEMKFDSGDRFLICSDGVTDGILDSELEGLMRNGSDVDSIIECAVRVSGKDNATAILIDIL
ncbi:MAG: serine/threonine-protein phosphatase [Akkermansiaceae bacterium]|jgi:PPM family protein phosphatase|nr:serine/threonine-protein phosphatase [Akkermansiaceae bacterium]